MSAWDASCPPLRQDRLGGTREVETAPIRLTEGGIKEKKSRGNPDFKKDGGAAKCAAAGVVNSGGAKRCRRASDARTQTQDALFAAHLDRDGIARDFDAANPHAAGRSWKFVFLSHLVRARADDGEAMVGHSGDSLELQVHLYGDRRRSGRGYGDDDGIKETRGFGVERILSLGRGGGDDEN